MSVEFYEILIIVLQMVLIFFVKVFDNVLSTSKTILIQKNKGFFAACTVVISQIIFYKLIDAVSNSESDLTMYIVAIASGFGTFLAVKLSEKISKDRVFVNVIMSDNKEAMIELRDFLKENHITNLATEGFTKDWGKTIAITAYTETKFKNKLLDDYIENSNVKFKRVITKE